MEIKLPRAIQKKMGEVYEGGEVLVDFRKEPWSFAKRGRWTILTDRRVIIIKKKYFGLSYDIWPLYLDPLSVDMNEAVIFDTIYMDYLDQKFVIQFFRKDRFKTLDFFQEINRQKMTPKKEGKEKQEIFDELEELEKVFCEKIITKKEFDKKKKELMDKL